MASFPAFNPADFQGEITLDHVISEASPNFAPLPPDLRPELVTALAGRGIQRLYSHQADAYQAAITTARTDPHIAGIFFWGWGSSVGQFSPADPAVSVLHAMYT